jgi:hypothetical protein
MRRPRVAFLEGAMIFALWQLLLLPLDAVADNHDFTMISAQVGCEIRAMRDDAGTRLDAIIYASGNVTGTYVFEVRRLRSGKLETERGSFRYRK